MKIGINVMSSIKEMREDFEGIASKLKSWGCDYFEVMSDWGARQETVDYYAQFTGESHWDRENTLKRLGYLRSIGMDIKGMFVFDELLEEQAKDLGIYCRDNCIGYVVLSFLGYGTVEEIYEKIGLIKTVSAVLKDYGVRLYLHNHEHDMNRVTDRDGREKAMIDVFLEHLSPEELMLEVDTGWLIYAGIDPAVYVAEHEDRIAILHLKDIVPDFKTRDRDKIFVACGKGVTDFKALFNALSPKKRDEILYVIDQDNSQGSILDDLRDGIVYLKAL